MGAFRRTKLREALRPAGRRDPRDVRLEGPKGVIAERVTIAATPLRRMRGLIAKPSLARDEALLLEPCTRVHTIGVRYPIDAVFCDEEFRVLAVQTLEPRRVSRPVPAAACCIEMRAGRAESSGLTEGSRLRIAAHGEASE